MEIFDTVSPVLWASLILGSATVFTVFWTLDSLTHKKLAKIDITDNEFQTHRNILSASFLMEISLVLMYWQPLLMLPIFIALFITRTAHEFIDEVKYHADRCTPYETQLHLAMWVSVLTKTGAMFLWGFFTRYAGIESLPIIYYIWGLAILMVMGFVSWKEWQR